jgi:nucleotide-binding universal stress UspA family protein
MVEFKKILFPTDLTEVSKKIAPYVLALVEKFDSEVHLLFVARHLKDFDRVYVPIPSIDKFEAEITEGANQKINEFSQEFFKDCRSCKEKVLTGDASEEIVNYIKSEGIDLVVMGTHGRKKLDRVLFGSVAENVVKMATVPVLTVNPYRVTLP